jgi:adenylate cyclase
MSTGKPSFFAELKRRNVYKVAIAYAVVGWLLIQVATQVFPFLQIPDWAIRLAIVLLALGFPIALLLAWDPLRSDPRFKTMVNGSEPKTVYH